MKYARIWDRLGIALSFVCLVHCLALPVAVVAFPMVAMYWGQSGAFHVVMAITLFPVAIFAIAAGVRIHGRFGVVGAIAGGLSLISTAAFAGERWLTPGWETILTVVGGAILVAAHGVNYWLCRTCPSCASHVHGRNTT